MLLLATVLTAFVAVDTAGAQSTTPARDTVGQLRAEADAIAQRYFDALTRAEALDAEVTRDRDEIADLEARAERLRIAARDRALVAYRQSGSRLAAVLDGDDTLDAARRARWIDQVNEADHDSFRRLRALSEELDERRQALEATRDEHATTLEKLREQGAAVDAKLADAAQREALAVVAATATTTPAATSAPTTPSSVTPAAPPTATSPPPATPPAPPYSGTPGTHPHHDDPFLTCVRNRESSGNYSAVNPSGPYLGAYQFLQSTWNATANHAGRPELIGVPANVASPYDQDDLAWVLYQWQGAGPWGGTCH